jgi:hypothetical protein
MPRKPSDVHGFPFRQLRGAQVLECVTVGYALSACVAETARYRILTFSRLHPLVHREIP